MLLDQFAELSRMNSTFGRSVLLLGMP